MIKPDSWACIKGEGMPVQGRPFDKGNLYIHFTGGCRAGVGRPPACGCCRHAGMGAGLAVGWHSRTNALAGAGASSAPRCQ